ncbi:MAG TPA: hypothetical protein VFC44_15580 [Candidatus Saccharimonadales bacterium]|nr:hypothetical protein [Candidatus Saccharimonadales bacterium]
MNFSARFYKAALAVVAVILFCGVAQLQNSLNLDREKLGLTRLTPLENAPPVLAFTTVALGGFRGLIANALWIRANDLQEEDKYFEMVQLADWITKLEPHFVDVWRVQAWNMAYNISVKFKDPEDRWHWVERGIQLLRDDGLRYNPHETLLYRDLSWLFQHKIGQNLDDAHMRYKLRLAQEFQDVLGGRPDFKELLHPTTPEARERVRKLREVYKMDPAIVQKVDEEYGPLDWRLPDAHAIYWAEMGRLNAKPEDQETLRRSIYQSMQQATFRGGALSSSITNVTEQNFLLWPNLDLVPKVNAAYEKMIAEEVRNPHGFQQNMQTAHKNFLKQAIYLLYEDNREKQAAYWFKYLNTIYPNAFVGKEAHITLENFAISQIIEDNGETDMSKVSASIMGMIHRSFFYLIADNDDKAYNYRNLAQRIWNHYHAKTEGVSEQRLALKPFPEMYRFVLDRELNPTNGILSAQGAALLRTKLGLRAGEMAPPPSAPAKP